MLTLRGFLCPNTAILVTNSIFMYFLEESGSILRISPKKGGDSYGYVIESFTKITKTIN